MAFEIPEAEFEAQRAALVAAGFRPRPGEDPVLASRTMYVDDPDGNEVELSAAPPPIIGARQRRSHAQASASANAGEGRTPRLS